MFFFISKILSFLITPILWIFTLLLFAFISKNPKRKKRCLIGAVVLFYFFSNTFLLNEVSRLWEIPATPYKELKTYDVGIVLSGMLRYDIAMDRIQFESGADRLFQAVELYKTGVIKKILITGGSGNIESAYVKEALFARRYLLTIGIPDKDIWIESDSRNTRENAVFTKQLIDKKEYMDGKFLLITSARHMRRSLACFKKVGINAEPYSVDRDTGPVRRFSLYFLIPNAETLVKWESIFHEWIGLLVYKIKGYA